MSKDSTIYIQARRRVEYLKDFESKVRKLDFYIKQINNEINSSKNDEISKRQKELIDYYGLNEFFNDLGT